MALGQGMLQKRGTLRAASADNLIIPGIKGLDVAELGGIRREYVRY